jgi:hypothetical protein
LTINQIGSIAWKERNKTELPKHFTKIAEKVEEDVDHAEDVIFSPNSLIRRILVGDDDDDVDDDDRLAVKL